MLTTLGMAYYCSLDVVECPQLPFTSDLCQVYKHWSPEAVID